MDNTSHPHSTLYCIGADQKYWHSHYPYLHAIGVASVIAIILALATLVGIVFYAASGKGTKKTAEYRSRVPGSCYARRQSLGSLSTCNIGGGGDTTQFTQLKAPLSCIV